MKIEANIHIHHHHEPEGPQRSDLAVIEELILDVLRRIQMTNDELAQIDTVLAATKADLDTLKTGVESLIASNANLNQQLASLLAGQLPPEIQAQADALLAKANANAAEVSATLAELSPPPAPAAPPAAPPAANP